MVSSNIDRSESGYVYRHRLPFQSVRRLVHDHADLYSSFSHISLNSLTDCSGNGNNETLATSTATVTGLDPNTPCYFAVSAYNVLSEPCSNEALTVTPPSGVLVLVRASIRAPAVLSVMSITGSSHRESQVTALFSVNIRQSVLLC